MANKSVLLRTSNMEKYQQFLVENNTFSNTTEFNSLHAG